MIFLTCGPVAAPVVLLGENGRVALFREGYLIADGQFVRIYQTGESTIL